MSRKPKLSASIMCADLIHLGRDIQYLRKGGIDYLHFDVMDGHFVPSVGLGIFFLEQITAAQDIPVEVHLMVTDSEQYIDDLASAGASRITFHYEGCGNPGGVLHKIRKKNIEAGLALRPETKIESIEPYLDLLDMVLLMAYPPGIQNQKPVPGFEKIVGKAVNFLDKQKNKNIDVAIDGGISLDLLDLYYKNGANFFILGSSGLFLPGVEILSQIGKIREIIA